MATALGGVEGCSKDYVGPGRKVCVEVGRSLVGRSAVVPMKGVVAIFLSFTGDARHISAGFLICLQDPDCGSKILDITKHSV